MRKVILGVAVVLALASASVNAAEVYKDSTTQVDVYGYTKGAHTFNRNQGKNGSEASEAQIGVKLKQQLNPLFALIGQYEGEYDVNNTFNRHWHNRKAFGGIDAGTYGVVTVGRQQGVVYNIMGLTDVNPETVSGWSSAADTGLLGRTDSVVQYQNSFGNTTITGQYKLATTKSLETGKAVNEGAAYGASVVANDLAGTGAFVGAAYSNQKDATPAGADSNVYAVGAGIHRGAVYFAATSTFGKNATGVKSYFDNEVIGTYTVNSITTAVGYVDSNAFGYRAKYVESGLAYAFNKNVTADVGFGYDVSGGGNHLVKTGLKYSF